MMFGGNNNHVYPGFLEENQFQFDSNASTQLQLFGNLPAGFSVDPVNYVTNEQISTLSRPTKRYRESDDITRQQKLQISLNNNIYQDDTDRSTSIPNTNPVSTGLRLAYDDDERNSSVTSASGNIAPPLPIIMSLGDNLRSEMDRQKEEFDHYIRVQQEHMMKGVMELKQRHMVSFLGTIEKGVSKKLREKDIEIENINRKNKELVERIKQVAMDAQSWQYRAKYNETMANNLKMKLKQAIAQGADQVREGCGDSEVDDAASSYIDQKNNFQISIPSGSGNHQKSNEQIICRACKGKEVSILLLPCRHLCLCKDCETFISVCPICQSMKTASVQVYMS